MDIILTVSDGTHHGARNDEARGLWWKYGEKGVTGILRLLYYPEEYRWRLSVLAEWLHHWCQMIFWGGGGEVSQDCFNLRIVSLFLQFHVLGVPLIGRSLISKRHISRFNCRWHHSFWLNISPGGWVLRFKPTTYVEYTYIYSIS